GHGHAAGAGHDDDDRGDVDERRRAQAFHEGAAEDAHGGNDDSYGGGGLHGVQSLHRTGGPRLQAASSARRRRAARTLRWTRRSWTWVRDSKRSADTGPTRRTTIASHSSGGSPSPSSSETLTRVSGGPGSSRRAPTPPALRSLVVPRIGCPPSGVTVTGSTMRARDGRAVTRRGRGGRGGAMRRARRERRRPG